MHMIYPVVAVVDGLNWAAGVDTGRGFAWHDMVELSRVNGLEEL